MHYPCNENFYAFIDVNTIFKKCSDRIQVLILIKLFTYKYKKCTKY